MKYASLFSGIGGPDLAAEWMGWDIVFQVENDSYCQSILTKNFPKTKKYGDIKEFNGAKYKGTIDVLTGGFPCQDLSVANSTGRAGFEGEKSGLYHELIRVIGEIKPNYTIIENVYGLVTQNNGQALETMLSDLADLGYEAIPIVIYASAIGANHHRKRVFTYATRIRDRIQESEIQAGRDELKYSDWWATESGVCRVYDGLPKELDKRRLKALGNAIPPQVALDLFRSLTPPKQP